MRIALGLLLLGACVHTDSADCGGDVVCRAGTTCHDITLGSVTSTECVSDDQLEKCKGMPDLMSCDAGRGTCYSEACLPAGCGNGRIDGVEDCDDGNVALGDGCSSSCRSEVCGNGIVDPVDTSSGTAVPKEQCDDDNTLSHDGCASTCLPEVLRWRKLPTTPLVRSFSPMAVDLNTRKAILFGGFIPYNANASAMGLETSIIADPDLPLTGTPNGETWELSVSGWTRIDSIPSPSPRGGHSLVYDGKRTLLVGGAQNEIAIFGDVWALANGAWTRLEDLPTAMGPRAGAATAYWPGHGVILFGGLGFVADSTLNASPTTLGDTWYLKDNETEWKKLDTSGAPEARVFATLTYDPAHAKLLLVGGAPSYSDHTPLSSWSFDDNGWTQLDDANAPVASGAVAAYDPALGVVVADGQTDGGERSAAVWSWNNNTWTRGTDSPRAGRYGASGGVDPISGHLQMFGGVAPGGNGCGLGCQNALPNGNDADPYALEVLTYGDTVWSTRNIVPTPPQLARHSYAYDSERARTVVFGGIVSGVGKEVPVDGVTSDLHELVEHTWFKPEVGADEMTGTRPAARHSAGLAYAEIGSTHGTYMFGGSSNAATVTPLNDFWRLEATVGGKLAWHTLVGGPAARSGAGMVYDVARHRLVMFGGSTNDDTRLNDTCEYDGTAWTCTNIPNSPAPRADAAFAYDPRHHLVVMWGGTGTKTPEMLAGPVFDDLWTYDGVTWRQANVMFGPSARSGARFVWDARRQRMVLWGGTSTDTSIWELDGTNWSFVPAFDAPEFPRAYSMLVQSADGGIIAHGGIVSDATLGFATDSLQLVRETSTQTQYTSCHSQFDEDNDHKLGCEDPDCWAYCTPLCPPGATGADCELPLPMTPSSSGCGNGTCEAPRENCGICPEDCGACPVNP